jgi:hypothetical protein
MQIDNPIASRRRRLRSADSNQIPGGTCTAARPYSSSSRTWSIVTLSNREKTRQKRFRLERLIAAPEEAANHTEIPALFKAGSLTLGVLAQK